MNKLKILRKIQRFFIRILTRLDRLERTYGYTDYEIHDYNDRDHRACGTLFRCRDCIFGLESTMKINIMRRWPGAILELVF
jgi:hypothetical protein